MARKVVILALLCFVLVGQAYAAPEEKPAAAAGVPESQGHDDHTGNNEAQTRGAGADLGFAVAGPVGTLIPDGAFSGSITAEAPAPSNSGASTLELSALAGLAAAAFGSLF